MVGYVRYVGRVGALAVALGVGWAAATTPGVALAEPTDSSATSSASTSPADSSSANEKPAATRSSSNVKTPSSSTSSAETDGTSSAASSTPDSSTGDVQTTGGAQAAGGGDSASAATSTPSDKDLPTPTAASSPKGDTNKAAKGSSRSAPSAISTFSLPQEDPISIASTLQSPSAIRVTSTTSIPAGRTLTVAVPTTASPPIAAAANSTATVTPHADPPPFSGPLAPLNIVTSVVSTLLGWAGLGPSMTASPVAPIQEPVLWTLLAFVRREIEQTLLSFAPAGHPHVAGPPAHSPNL